MPKKKEYGVGLHRNVGWFLRRCCNQAEMTAFHIALRQVRNDPVSCSEALVDRRLSRYMLRFFRFGDNMGVFKLDAARNRILVLECRRFRGKHG
jgi:hypothetical protein